MPRFIFTKILLDTAEEIYWRGIPYSCRECIYVHECRTGWKEGRKCRNGCIKRKLQSEAQRAEEREDYMQNLLKYVDEEAEKGRL